MGGLSALGVQAWLYDEILEVDEALAVMVARTHNNALMQTASGKDLTFIRVGAPEESSTNVAWNKDGSGKITISDLAFDAYNSASEEAKVTADDFFDSLI